MARRSMEDLQKSIDMYQAAWERQFPPKTQEQIEKEEIRNAICIILIGATVFFGTWAVMSKYGAAGFATGALMLWIAVSVLARCGVWGIPLGIILFFCTISQFF